MKKISLVAIATICSIFTFGQDSMVKMFGKIIDENKNPITNVKIVLKGTKYETMTNSEGYYFFMLPDKKGVLVYSHSRYETKKSNFTGTPQATDLYLVVKNNRMNYE